MWTFVTVFFFDFFSDRGHSAEVVARHAGVVGFSVIAAGALGCVVAGVAADRFGRADVTILAIAVSGTCALLIGHLLQAPAWLLVSLALVWGFAVVADSAQFSAVVTEVALSHAVGTALTLQTSAGFLLTTVTISAAPVLREWEGWPLAFGVLALGPLAGIVSMWKLRR